MAVRPVQMWQVVCDRCGHYDDTADYFAWRDADSAEWVAEQEAGWLVRNGHHYCPACIEWNQAEDMQVPKP
jgi:hypothetical protein